MQAGPPEDVTCKEYVLPKLKAAGWSEQQIVSEYWVRRPTGLAGSTATRTVPNGRADYVLEIVPGLPIAVVEAKREYKSAGDAVGQAVEYAHALDVPIAYASNGIDIRLRDRLAGSEDNVETFMTPVEAWATYVQYQKLDDEAQQALKQRFNRALLNADGAVKEPRYYQRVAIHRALRALLAGERRLLLLMATGTGKTFTALQLVAKLRNYWAQTDPEANHRILYLADRDWLIRQPYGQFAEAFSSDAITRIKSASSTSRDVYFATYQALDQSADRGELLTLFREYPPDFFDLVIVDECHRGSARQESAWHAILKHFEPAAQLGLTATPKRDTNVDTYEYFGEPVYEYSLRKGIEDRYLAPYRIRRVVLSVDTDGWRPTAGQVDDQGQAIPDREYRAPDFERTLVLRERTSAVARHLASILGRKPTHRAIIFCVDSDHADRMRQELGNALPDQMRRDPEWVVRIVSAEPRAQSYLERFADPETKSPVVATTSQMLSTGVDIEDLRYVVLFRNVGSMVEFKQIVGRGTRIHPASGKTDFEIIDYVGATTHFADPAFDGPPQKVVRRKLRDDGGEDPIDEEDDEVEPLPVDPVDDDDPTDNEGTRRRRDRFVVSGQRVELVGELFYVHDIQGSAPRLVQYIDYAAEQVRQLTPDFEALRAQWSSYPTRVQIEQGLADRGIDLSRLADLTDLAGSDPFDVLAHVAWRLTPETRAERARRVRSGAVGELARYAEPAREVLEALLDRYADFGVDDVADPHSLQLPPVRELGSLGDLAARFGGAPELHRAVDDLQTWLYSA